jgi:hypothetical protein
MAERSGPPAQQGKAKRHAVTSLHRQSPGWRPLPSMAEDTSAINTIDIDNLPAGIVTGSNLIQFPADASPELKSSVALSLLAAQRVATNDPPEKKLLNRQVIGGPRVRVADWDRKKLEKLFLG